MSSSHTWLKSVRQIHLYLGVFTAPALLFFAFTGALQTFSLHETTRGSSYKPPAWAVTLAQIHKKQTPIVPVRRLPLINHPTEKSTTPDRQTLSATPPAPKPPDAAPQKTHNALPLKIFFLFVAMSLFVSTLTGIYMSYKYVRNGRLITAILAAGMILPVLLVIF
jgi:hypothetical protein